MLDYLTPQLIAYAGIVMTVFLGLQIGAAVKCVLGELVH